MICLRLCFAINKSSLLFSKSFSVDSSLSQGCWFSYFNYQLSAISNRWKVFSPGEMAIYGARWGPGNQKFHQVLTSPLSRLNQGVAWVPSAWECYFCVEMLNSHSSFIFLFFDSIRWKTLLSFNCRNRLLLTGTPIQNNMAELWALLHFIMPMLFDSHEQFNEWFSRWYVLFVWAWCSCKSL